MVRKALEVLEPRPWTVASTEGWGEELFNKRIEAGRAKVRAATCRNRTTLMPNHIGTPAAGAGGTVLEGKRARKGVRK